MLHILTGCRCRFEKKVGLFKMTCWEQSTALGLVYTALRPYLFPTPSAWGRIISHDTSIYVPDQVHWMESPVLG